ncbi:MAG: IS110 family transposase [Candidatus Methylomirabilaceae bacterium]
MLYVGLDLGDRWSQVHVLDGEGDLVEETRLPTSASNLGRRFSGIAACRVAMEVGVHSPWVSRLLQGLGHETIVADARKLRLIYRNPRKNDSIDAEYLARLARLDPKLLSPVRHRSPEAQADLALLRSRDTLVRARTMMINHARGLAKSAGQPLPSCSADAFPHKVRLSLPEALKPALEPLLETIGVITQAIRAYDRQIEALCRSRYPETERLRQVAGVGPLTSLAYLLSLEDPQRFRKSREVGPFLGLVPRQNQSGGSDPQLRITKTGDPYLRRLLVGSAQYLLGPFGPDCELRRWGLKLAERGGLNAKKRAVVGVARKLAVLLHRLWLTGEHYLPLYHTRDAALELGPPSLERPAVSAIA